MAHFQKYADDSELKNTILGLGRENIGMDYGHKKSGMHSFVSGVHRLVLTAKFAVSCACRYSLALGMTVQINHL